jgi:hypothetical protein
MPARRSTKAAKAQVEDVEEEELEELEEAEETEAPKKRGGAAQEVTFGVADVCLLIKKKTGETVTTRALRTLIRKMARDDTGRIDREIVAGNRSRYDWSGPNDPEVKAIVKAYTDGELEADKQEKLAALKERKATKPAKKSAAKKTSTKRRAPEPVEELEDEDEELELEEDED